MYTLISLVSDDFFVILWVTKCVYCEDRIQTWQLNETFKTLTNMLVLYELTFKIGVCMI